MFSFLPFFKKKIIDTNLLFLVLSEWTAGKLRTSENNGQASPVSFPSSFIFVFSFLSLSISVCVYVYVCWGRRRKLLEKGDLD